MKAPSRVGSSPGPGDLGQGDGPLGRQGSPSGFAHFEVIMCFPLGETIGIFRARLHVYERPTFASRFSRSIAISTRSGVAGASRRGQFL